MYNAKLVGSHGAMLSAYATLIAGCFSGADTYPPEYDAGKGGLGGNTHTAGSGGNGGAGGVEGTGASGGAGGAAGAGGGNAAICGDGMKTYPETCDDDNEFDEDTCSSDCTCGSAISESMAFRYNSSCYSLVRVENSWENARSACLEAGMNLASISTETERAIVAVVINQTDPERSVWIGGNDRTTEGQFVWEGGEAWDIRPCLVDAGSGCDNNVDLWATTNEPNGQTDENCVELRENSDKFNDQSCEMPQWFLCEQ